MGSLHAHSSCVPTCAQFVCPYIHTVRAALHAHSSCVPTYTQFVCPYIHTVSVPLHAHSLCIPTYAQLVKGIPKKEKRKKICNVSYIVIVIQLLNMHISNKLLSYIIISLLQVFKRKNGPLHTHS